MTEQKAMLQINDLHKKIGKHEIIKGLSLEVNKGEVFGFLGPNGAGKTTTIRMMVGLTTPTSGQILIGGEALSNNRKHVLKKIGAIVENPEMYPFLSGLDNLKHYARMQPNITKEDIDRVVKLVGLEHRIKDKVKKYSLGMRQRLGLAQALLHKPELLILDEPTNGLDPAGIREIRDYIRNLAKEEGLSVIVSSHLLSEMELMCDRIGIIKDGEMIRIENVHEQNNQNLIMSYDVNPIEKAEQWFKTNGYEYNIQDNQIKVKINKEDVPITVQALVAASVSIYSINEERSSLEDRFLNITGGVSHD
ncbi:ABC transporter ATP-binding protein [Macrococcus sp. DPC7161]|uniref:ABC transporter ATP-binding protein n=1 Tax=Macrococcus sp. DPC7161 TaxID=2507060 RepID=UPI00100A7AA3|nr:ABC transporter ATP-binding protein [Macrococcus sp. DPC7161]RXK18130.1 ABC transporter ATP-binding protein [Macrococcus sp. DPC7161]